MNIDQDVIEAKLDIIERNLVFLNEFKGMDYDDFAGSYKNVQSAKYSLLEIIECCIDIASHIIAVRGLGRAEEYREMFFLLGERSIIDKGHLLNDLEIWQALEICWCTDTEMLTMNTFLR